MRHQRSEIRDTVLKVLRDRLSGDIHVLKSRGTPVVAEGGSRAIPAVSVYITKEEVTEHTDYYTQREATLVVEGALAQRLNDAGEIGIEELDQFSDAAEEILLTDTSLRSKIVKLRLEDVEFGVFEESPNLLMFQHTYELTYYKMTKAAPEYPLAKEIYADVAGDKLPDSRIVPPNRQPDASGNHRGCGPQEDVGED